MTLSANFTSKSVFDQQGCRALTFALAARLSCHSRDAKRKITAIANKKLSYRRETARQLRMSTYAG